MPDPFSLSTVGKSLETLNSKAANENILLRVTSCTPEMQPSTMDALRVASSQSQSPLSTLSLSIVGIPATATSPSHLPLSTTCGADSGTSPPRDFATSPPRFRRRRAASPAGRMLLQGQSLLERTQSLDLQLEDCVTPLRSVKSVSSIEVPHVMMSPRLGLTTHEHALADGSQHIFCVYTHCLCINTYHACSTP